MLQIFACRRVSQSPLGGCPHVHVLTAIDQADLYRADAWQEMDLATDLREQPIDDFPGVAPASFFKGIGWLLTGSTQSNDGN